MQTGFPVGKIGLLGFLVLIFFQCSGPDTALLRERISINDHWRYFKYDSLDLADNLIYDVRPEITDIRESWVADEKPTEAVNVEAAQQTLKAWILPSGNRFIGDPGKHFQRPDGNPGSRFPFVQPGFDDTSWEEVSVPHDWAIRGPFIQGWGCCWWMRSICRFICMPLQGS